MQLNDALFEMNGGCGFILKPNRLLQVSFLDFSKNKNWNFIDISFSFKIKNGK